MRAAASPTTRSVPAAAGVGLLDETELFRRYRSDGDMQARAALIESMLPLARRLAARYRRTDELQDDLVQVACLGLLKAVDRFEPGEGRALVRYATPTILGELRRHFRDRGWAVKVPRAIQERVLAMNSAVARLSSELGRPPKPSDLAADLGCSLEEVIEAKEASGAYSTTSLDAPAPGMDSEDGLPYRERLPVEEPGYEMVELGTAIAPALAQMSDRDRRMLHLRFVEDLTQTEIAARVGLSQMHVSRVLRQSLTRLSAARDAAPQPVAAARGQAAVHVAA